MKSDNLYVHLAPGEMGDLQKRVSRRGGYRSFAFVCAGVAVAIGLLLMNARTSLLNLSQNHALYATGGVFALFFLLALLSLRN